MSYPAGTTLNKLSEFVDLARSCWGLGGYIQRSFQTRCGPTALADIDLWRRLIGSLEDAGDGGRITVGGKVSEGIGI
jgi:hypothetical protein